MKLHIWSKIKALYLQTYYSRTYNGIVKYPYKTIVYLRKRKSPMPETANNSRLFLAECQITAGMKQK